MWRQALLFVALAFLGSWLLSGESEFAFGGAQAPETTVYQLQSTNQNGDHHRHENSSCATVVSPACTPIIDQVSEWSDWKVLPEGLPLPSDDRQASFVRLQPETPPPRA